MKVIPDPAGFSASKGDSCNGRRTAGAGAWIALIGLLGLIWVLPAHAETRQLEVTPGVFGNADFFRGSAARPAVLILHGFLQTRHFPTVGRMTEGLAELDYTVLTPTLSLGIPHRRQSQPCEALHLHKLGDNVAEIARWVEWLHRESGRPVMVVAHSAAAHTMTRFLKEYPEAPLQHLVLISPGYLVGRPLGPEPQQEEAIAVYSLEFCLHYPTTPEAFRSYVDWGPRQMLDALDRRRDRVSVIIGSGDERLSPTWIQSLRANGIDISVIQGADHFFASSHEFELLEEVARHLREHSRQ